MCLEEDPRDETLMRHVIQATGADVEVRIPGRPG